MVWSLATFSCLRSLAVKPKRINAVPISINTEMIMRELVEFDMSLKNLAEGVSGDLNY